MTSWKRLYGKKAKKESQKLETKFLIGSKTISMDESPRQKETKQFNKKKNHE